MPANNTQNNEENTGPKEKDPLIVFEARIIGIVVFFLCLLQFKSGIVQSLVIGAVTVFVLPIIVVNIKALSWIFMVAFSLVWALAGYFLGSMIAGDSLIVGIIVAIIVFAISFFMHADSMKIKFEDAETRVTNALDEMQDNTDADDTKGNTSNDDYY